MQLKIQAARVANRLLVFVAAPEGRDGRQAIRAGHSGAPVCLLGNAPRRFREGPIGVVVLMVQAASVAKIVARLVASPEGRRSGAAIDTLLASGAHLEIFSV